MRILRLALTAGLLASLTAHAQSNDCPEATLLEQSFESGASWALCASVNEQHALEVTSVHYRSPGGILRSVLALAHIGQILMHYHDESDPRAQINDAAQTRLLAMNDNNCDGAALLDNGSGATLCSRIEDNRILAKYAHRPGLQSWRWELSSALQRDGLVWTTSISFTEDGQIIPALTLSGRARENLASPGVSTVLPASRRNLARATVLATWRLVFNLDSSAHDKVQQFDFPLNVAQGNRRPMQVSDLDTELFASVDQATFRGWRVSDPNGRGYYLDPSNSGFTYTSGNPDWTQFDVALTRYDPCERYASSNTTSTDEHASCGTTLDDFVSGELLHDTHPVLWFSQSRTFNPSNEDWPAIRNLHQSFSLLPYDWTPTSPFEVIE